MEATFGVCRLSVVSVRKDAQVLSAQVSQLLFGDHYEVIGISPDKHWIQIRIYFDQVEGWIPLQQHHAIASEYFDQINSADFKITTDVCSTILYKKTPLSILMGSIVPISQSELFKMEEQFAFNGESKSLGQKREFEFFKLIALKYLNAPEMEGGKTPFGIDGLGLVQMVHRICGYTLGHSTENLHRHGRKVESTSGKPGDIVFLSASDQGTKSVGLLMEDGKILHVEGRVKLDSWLGEKVIDVDTKRESHTIELIRRYLNE
ncbi:MAG: C40 family peptidase [Bacteroidetes bacterium]|nr:C40 family peptidase [Bacteroidota bacterium]